MKTTDISKDIHLKSCEYNFKIFLSQIIIIHSLVSIVCVFVFVCLFFVGGFGIVFLKTLKKRFEFYHFKVSDTR